MTRNELIALEVENESLRKRLKEQKTELIDKACKWLETHYNYVDDFRKAMEEEK